MRRSIIILTAVLTGSTVLLSATPAHATAHGKNGRIAFRRYLNADHTRGALFTLNPDGTGIRQLTHPPRMTITTNPDWKPNRRWIAYSSYGHADEDSSRLYKIHPNGTGRRSLSGSCTGRCVIDDQAEWGPHGKRIAFQRGLKFRPNGLHNTFIFVMRADGTHPRRITQRRADPSVVHHFSDRAPTWSPNAKRLAFERADQSDAGGRSDHHAIFTVRLDGTGLHRITPWRLDAAQPDWSPNGRWIVFHQDQVDNPETSNVWLVHPNGTGGHRVTHDLGGSGTWLGTTFSPNGRKITAARTNGVGTAGNADLYVMNIDGSGLRNITLSTRWESTPDWGPQPRRR
jgi:Tol biopolymer transport system component